MACGSSRAIGREARKTHARVDTFAQVKSGRTVLSPVALLS